MIWWLSWWIVIMESEVQFFLELVCVIGDFEKRCSAPEKSHGPILWRPQTMMATRYTMMATAMKIHDIVGQISPSYVFGHYCLWPSWFVAVIVEPQSHHYTGGHVCGDEWVHRSYSLRKRQHGYQLHHIEYNLYKTTFINCCLFNFKWLLTVLHTLYPLLRPVLYHYLTT